MLTITIELLPFPFHFSFLPQPTSRMVTKWNEIKWKAFKLRMEFMPKIDIEFMGTCGSNCDYHENESRTCWTKRILFNLVFQFADFQWVGWVLYLGTRRPGGVAELKSKDFINRRHNFKDSLRAFLESWHSLIKDASKFLTPTQSSSWNNITTISIFLPNP